MAEGFSFVQMIRPLIREPDFIMRIKHELSQANVCFLSFGATSRTIFFFRNDRTRILTFVLSCTCAKKQPDESEEFDIASKCIRCNQWYGDLCFISWLFLSKLICAWVR